MNNLIVKEFNGNKIHTFMWNDKPCWIANEIVNMFGYSDPSTTIRQCVEAEEFEEGIEYKILIKEELKCFKRIVKEVTKLNLVGSELINKYTSSLIIFYEDGLYGFLQYTDKPIGVQFRRWIRREVLPEIRQTGSYISDKANPETLREKANELEKLETINKSVELVSPLLDVAGVDNTVKLLVVKTLFSKAGVDIPIEIEAKEKFYDTKQIAKMVGMYSKTGNPAFGAVGQIIKKLDIEEHEKEVVWESSGSWQGTVIKYTESVSDKVNKWLKENGYPVDIPSKNKTFHVVYKPLREVAI